VTAAELIAAGRTLVIAHRGDSQAAPENTLPAFESALRGGADVVELDYRETADGVPVVIHDESLDRTTDAVTRWRRAECLVCQALLAELQGLDAGSWFGGAFRDARVPTLAEALGMICSRAIAAIERKQGSAETLIALLTEHGWLDQVAVMAFDWPFLAACRQLAPQLVLVALGDGPLDDARLDELAATGASVAGWDQRDVAAPLVSAVHRRGLKSWVWTADEEARWAELLAAGVDGITSNRPVALRTFLCQRAGD
jgi:glycerophosphoryl diester phosphodiesterase